MTIYGNVTEPSGGGALSRDDPLSIPIYGNMTHIYGNMTIAFHVTMDYTHIWQHLDVHPRLEAPPGIVQGSPHVARELVPGEHAMSAILGGGVVLYYEPML